MILKIDSIKLKRGSKVLLDNFNLNIQKSQILIIRGNNGSGKSSLLESIVNIIQISKGKILFKNTLTWNQIKKKSSYIFYLGHDNCLKENLTISQNLLIWAEIFGLKISESDIKQKLEYFDLDTYFNFEVKDLSLGQKRKLALTKLLFIDSKFWILDEPLNGLDEISEKKFLKLIEKHRDNGGSVVLSAHKNLKPSEYKILNLNDHKKEKLLLNSWNSL